VSRATFAPSNVQFSVRKPPFALTIAHHMRSIALIASIAALAVPAAGTTLASASTAGGGPAAHIACTRAKIDGQSKCIARGQFCKHTARAEKDYERYGFRCNKRDARGNWHLT
jgi:hypothetical protein